MLFESDPKSISSKHILVAYTLCKRNFKSFTTKISVSRKENNDMERRQKSKLLEFIKEHIKQNYKEYMVILIFFVVGIFLGVFFINHTEESLITEVHQYLGDFINEVKDENSIKEFAEKFSDDMFQKLYAWQRNGGIATTDELSKLDNETRKDVLDYVSDFSWYEKVAVNGQKYLLVHGGLGNFDIKRDIDDYSLDELVWSRVDYDVRYFDDVITVTGHTPTRYIEDNPRPGYVYRKNNHIDIDCGAYLPGGRLAAICLDTGKEFYTSVNG